MTPVQPFSYQQSSHSCWITSMHNALLHLCGEKHKVPHKISRKLYFDSSEDGVSTGEMKKIAQMIRKAYGLKIFTYKNGKITSKLIRKALGREGAAIICDTNSGTHSLLLTGIRGEELMAFDPNWENVADCRTSRGRFYCCPYGDSERGLLNPRHNVSITLSHLMKEPSGKRERFIMGNPRNRNLLVLSRN